MKAIVHEAMFYAISSTIILPAPIVLLAWMTGKTFEQILFR